jgi:hypothetical protein
VAVVSKLVQKQERDSYIQKGKQYTNNTKTQNTQNTKQKYKTKIHKKNVKKHVT